MDDNRVHEDEPRRDHRSRSATLKVARGSLLFGVLSLLTLVLLTPFVAGTAAATAIDEAAAAAQAVGSLPGVDPALPLESEGTAVSASGLLAETAVETSNGAAVVTTEAGGSSFTFKTLDEGPALAAGAPDRYVSRARNSTTEYSTIVKSDGFPQVLITLNEPRRQHRKSFEFGAGTRLSLTRDGGVSITNRRGEEIATVETPWALDRNGRSVPTHFEVARDGRTLTQVVTPRASTAYPVVADPNVNCGIITCSLYLTRTETARLWGQLSQYQNSSTAAIGLAAGVACALVLSPTGPGAAIAAVICAGAAAIYGGFFIDKLGQAANSGNCLRVRYTTVPGLPSVPNGIYNDNSQYCKK